MPIVSRPMPLTPSSTARRTAASESTGKRPKYSGVFQKRSQPVQTSRKSAPAAPSTASAGTSPPGAQPRASRTKAVPQKAEAGSSSSCGRSTRMCAGASMCVPTWENTSSRVSRKPSRSNVLPSESFGCSVPGQTRMSSVMV